ncbi:hypothetical protein ACO1O0_000008 [Amphichorda felina]
MRGTTGLILADRLSESGDQNVLVLEAGPDPNVVAMHEAPGAVEFIAGKLPILSIYYKWVPFNAEQ